MTLKAAIKDEAHRLGFQLVGVTTPDPPPHLSVYRSWLDAGMHGTMAYLASDRAIQHRADPRAILPECRSILVLGLLYDKPPDVAPEDAGNIHGRVASYAWGADYHQVIPNRLEELVHFIERLAGTVIPNRWYTDTGPVMERDLAQRAGLGWIGKNTCLINPAIGSYLLLAEVLLGIELEPDAPFVTDHCGSCTRCIDACPTGCILPDRTIDARRCTSYLTIELKGPIPGELRDQAGDWVFGCDICQIVCPWNQRFAPSRGDPAFTHRPGIPHPDLIQELSLSPEQFNRKFKGTALKRPKRRGYLRNAAVALGNAGDQSAVPALSRALQSEPEPLVRTHAAWALGQIGGRVAAEGLVKSLQGEKDGEVEAAIHSALMAIGEEGTS
jgi:epoxyqueuosine reductase